MSTPNTLTRFAAAVELALTLPHPTMIYRAILSGTPETDDGLRGTAYDSDRTSGGTSSTHPERMLARKHPGQFPADDADDQRGAWGARTDRSKDDLLHLRRATDRAMDSISALNAECCDAGQPDDWDDALKCAHLLDETGTLAAAIDVGRDVDSWALRFAHAIDTVRAIRDSWMAHAPAPSVMEENYAWCRNHAKIGAEEKRTSRMLCRWCWEQIGDLAELGEPVVLQEDQQHWPSEGMMRALADGRMVDVKRERNDWLRGLGLNPERVHQRRQLRRGA